VSWRRLRIIQVGAGRAGYQSSDTRISVPFDLADDLVPRTEAKAEPLDGGVTIIPTSLTMMGYYIHADGTPSSNSRARRLLAGLPVVDAAMLHPAPRGFCVPGRRASMTLSHDSHADPILTAIVSFSTCSIRMRMALAVMCWTSSIVISPGCRMFLHKQ